VRKVLIANRGESAVRIARACRDADLASVAVYAPADRAALHVKAADQAVPLAGVTPGQTYLDMSQVLRAAAEPGADALHPGTGTWPKAPGSPRRWSTPRRPAALPAPDARLVRPRPAP
jgi:acetyl-CoA/propionyl-CoA carboxylase biotin carboxyl carrier protein